MKYETAVSWVDGFHQFGIRLGLDRIKTVLEKLDNPEKKTDFVHVAGTNGKGSVCRYINSILSSEGYRVGVYLSPHLIDFRERFQINNEYISKKRFAEIVEQIKPVVDNYATKEMQLTYFEICTIIAFVFFADENVDYAVIEVGLGGRYDATNVIIPIVSIITNVSMDHQHRLGNTIKDIAFEKAGIIKPTIPVVTAATDEALSVIQSICKKKNCDLMVVDDELIHLDQLSFSQQTVLFQGFFDDYMVTTDQLGSFQPENIGVSIATIECLQQQGIFVSKQSILNGIKKMNHPGRMQIIQNHPLIVVDGAHNTVAIKKSVESLIQLFHFNQVIIVFGVMKDKAINEMLSILFTVADIIILTQPKQNRAASVEDIAGCVQKINQSTPIIKTNSVHEAYQKALNLAKQNDLIFVTGSLFTVAEFLQIKKQ